MTGLARWVRIPGTVLLVLLVSSACQIEGHKTKAFVRRAGGITLVDQKLPPGEALIRVQNDSDTPARIIVAKVPSTDFRLPVGSDKTVPVGTVADLEYDGDGYRIVLKTDDLAPYFAHGRTKTTLHLHLDRGYYVIFSNRPGDYESGRQTVLTVS